MRQHCGTGPSPILIDLHTYACAVTVDAGQSLLAVAEHEMRAGTYAAHRHNGA